MRTRRITCWPAASRRSSTRSSATKRWRRSTPSGRAPAARISGSDRAVVLAALKQAAKDHGARQPLVDATNQVMQRLQHLLEHQNLQVHYQILQVDCQNLFVDIYVLNLQQHQHSPSLDHYK